MDSSLDRRRFLWQAGGGLGGVALAYLLGKDGLLAAGPHHPPKARRVVQPGFPSMGAWISYGLGSLTDDLPAFVVLPDSRGYAPNGPANWGSGFLPASHQGTMVRPGARNPIYDLFPPEGTHLTRESEA